MTDAPITLPADLLPADGRFGSGPSKVRPEQVEFLASLGTTVLGTWSNLNASSGYVLRSVNLSAFAGQTITLRFVGAEDSTLATSFLVDDVSLR